jgi:hypothetical protein
MSKPALIPISNFLKEFAITFLGHSEKVKRFAHGNLGQFTETYKSELDTREFAMMVDLSNSTWSTIRSDNPIDNLSVLVGFIKTTKANDFYDMLQTQEEARQLCINLSNIIINSLQSLPKNEISFFLGYSENGIRINYVKDFPKANLCGAVMNFTLPFYI